MLAACATTPAGDSAASSQPSSATATPVSSAFKPDRTLGLCPKINVRNAPATDSDGGVAGYRPFINVENEVVIAVDPVNGACLTSGFGLRSDRPHKGVDFQSNPAGTIHAVAAATVLEAGYRDDYGNYIVLEHTPNVFTRYAHLASIASGVTVGAHLPFGATLGVMGNTAKTPIALHLHYELLVGDYDTPKKSFGLMPKDPFTYPFVEQGE
ncbi:MAG: M23 family metallopeptidase [Hyphomonadaceae bacterium]